MTNLANWLTLMRLGLAPVLLMIAAGGHRREFLAVLGLSLLSDAIDGPIARFLHRASALGARLDSAADIATWLVLPVCAWWLWPHIVIDQAPLVLIAAVALAAPAACGLLRFGRLPSYHTWGAKASSVAMAIAVACLLLGGPVYPLRIAVAILAMAAIEELCITMVLPKPATDVFSLLHALRRIHTVATPCATSGARCNRR